MTHHPPRRRASGFTLIEMVVAMILLALIAGMVAKTASSSLTLGSNIVKSQNEEMMHQAFFQLLSRRFAALPGNTRFDLQVEDSGSHYISDLTLQNVPMSFTWGGQARIAKAVQISTVKKRSGYIDIVLRYYENEVLEGAESSFGSTALSKEPFAEIVLLTDVAYFEWRVLDGRSMEWQYDWELQGRLPLQVELTMAVGAKGEEIRQIFWIPAKQSSEIRMRQMAQATGAGSNNGGNSGGGGDDDDEGPGPGGPGGGETPPIIEIPTP